MPHPKSSTCAYAAHGHKSCKRCHQMLADPGINSDSRLHTPKQHVTTLDCAASADSMRGMFISYSTAPAIPPWPMRQSRSQAYCLTVLLHAGTQKRCNRTSQSRFVTRAQLVHKPTKGWCIGVPSPQDGTHLHLPWWHPHPWDQCHAS